MVYEDQTNQQDQENVGSQPGLVGAAPTENPATQSPQAGLPAPQQSSPEEGRQGSGRFTNIQKYIKANQPATQKIGQKIQQNLGEQAEGIRAGIQQSQNQFGQQASQVKSTLDKTGQYTQQIQQDPTQLLQNQQDLDTFRQIQGGQIATPESNLAVSQAQLQKFQNTANLTGNEAGRFQLLGNMFSNPANTYSRGQKRLDQLLLQNSPDVGANVAKTAQDQLRQTQGTFNPALQQQQTTAQELAQQKAQSQEQIANTLGGWGEGGTGQLGDMYSQIYNAQQAAAQKQNEELTKGKEALEKGELSNYTAQLLGLDPGTTIYGLDPKQYANMLKAGDTDVTMADVTNEQQQSRLNALSQLANVNNINLGEKYGNAGITGINPEDVKASIAAQRQDLVTALQPTYGELSYVAPHADSSINAKDYSTSRGFREAARNSPEFAQVYNQFMQTQSPEAYNAMVNYINNAGAINAGYYNQGDLTPGLRTYLNNTLSQQINKELSRRIGDVPVATGDTTFKNIT